MDSSPPTVPPSGSPRATVKTKENADATNEQREEEREKFAMVWPNRKKCLMCCGFLATFEFMLFMTQLAIGGAALYYAITEDTSDCAIQATDGSDNSSGVWCFKADTTSKWLCCSEAGNNFANILNSWTCVVMVIGSVTIFIFRKIDKYFDMAMSSFTCCIPAAQSDINDLEVKIKAYKARLKGGDAPLLDHEHAELMDLKKRLNRTTWTYRLCVDTAIILDRTCQFIFLDWYIWPKFRDEYKWSCKRWHDRLATCWDICFVSLYFFIAITLCLPLLCVRGCLEFCLFDKLPSINELPTHQNENEDMYPIEAVVRDPNGPTSPRSPRPTSPRSPRGGRVDLQKPQISESEKKTGDGDGSESSKSVSVKKRKTKSLSVS
jgi:hypothetical protein